MKTIDTLKAMADLLPSDLCRPTATIVSELSEFYDGATANTVSFTALWGAPIYLVETVEDLALVLSCDEGPYGRLSILAAASGAFDLASWSDNHAYAILGTIESNDGGPQYIIPKAIADQCANVAESIRLAAGSSDKEPS